MGRDGKTSREDEAGIISSRDKVNELIAQELDGGIPSDRIVVGGFSQGGALGLATGLTTPHKLAGITVLSGWFAIREKIKEVYVHDLIMVTSRFDESLLAPTTTRNRYSHLLGAWQE